MKIKQQLIFAMMITLAIPAVLMAVTRPEKVSITREGGVQVRDGVGIDAKAVGIAFEGYQYKVLDAQVDYYNITLPSGKTGWIYANPKNNWVERISSRSVKVLAQTGISVREDINRLKAKPIGTAAPGFEFPVNALLYSRIQIELPDKQVGWIYTGGSSENWIDFEGIYKVDGAAKNDIFLDYSLSKATGSIKPTSFKTVVNKKWGTLSLTTPGKSVVKGSFTLENKPSDAFIVLTHGARRKDKGKLSWSPVTLKVNGDSVMWIDPGKDAPIFAQDKIQISKFVRKGKNTFSLVLNRNANRYELRRIDFKVN